MQILLCFLFFIKSQQQSFFTYIPSEFTELKEEALSSAKKRINQIYMDDIISPYKPYIKDDFIGFVNNALFAQTVSNLRGFAISNDQKHMAIIVNRNTQDGEEMMKENSMFADEETKSVYSLFHKYADNGKVAIFNISKINEFQIFDRFQITLPRYSNEYHCTNTGKNFGGRCWKERSFNWENDMPGKTSINIKNFKFDVYYGMKSRAEVSLIVKKTGAFNIQAEMDSSYDFVGGVGFYIHKFNTTISNKNIIEVVKEEIGKKTIPIFFFNLEIKAFLTFLPTIEYFDARITKPISFIKIFKLHLKNNVVVSTKHKKTSETEKDFHIETVFDNGEIDDIDEFETEISFNGTIAFRSGIGVELSFGSFVNFKLECGPKIDFNMSFARNTTKCTAPGLFGHLIPTISIYLKTDGIFKIGFIKLFNKYSEKFWKIISFGKYGSCLYKDDISKELDDDIIDQSYKSLNILLYDNFSSSSDGIYSIANNLSDYNRFYNKYLFLERKNNSFNPKQAFVFTNENDNYTNLQYLINFNNNSFNGTSNVSELLNISDNFHYDATTKMKNVNTFFNFSLNSYKSSPILYGAEFVINNKTGFINSSPRNITQFPFNLGLIYKVNKRYHAHYDDYTIINEYEDTLHEEQIDDVYQSTDYSGFNITIQLNNPKDTNYCIDNEILKVFHIQNESHFETNNEHLLYVTRFGCNNSEINELFNSSLIFVPLTEVKGNVNCIRISYLNDSFYLTRNDLINPNNEIIIKSEYFTYKINVVYPEYPNYIFRLNKPKESFENQTVTGIVARFFQYKNDNVIPFDGIPQIINFQMAKLEVYGIYRGIFISHGENLSNTYALLHMPGIQPLTNNAELIESDSYYVKLVENETLIKRKSNSLDNSYDIIIPFRRRSVNRNDALEITLKMIFQTEESSRNDPYCSLFSQFNIKPNKNLYFGCIHNFSSNSWEHFLPNDEDIIREQEISIPNSKYKLHCINLKNLPKTRNDDLTIYATLKYVEFPLTSRFMIIENDTAELLNKYCNGEYLQVVCHRCDKIMIERDEFQIEMIKSPYYDYLYMIMIDDTFNSSFPLVAYCDSNSSAYCTFTIDVRNDGYVLIEYNPNFDTYTIMEKKELPDDAPGVEEIYDLNQYSNEKNETYDAYELNETDQTRLDLGFKRQIVHRDDLILATKPWEGEVIKKIPNMEINYYPLTLTYCTPFEDYFELSLHDNYGNDIPFSGKYFYQSINETNDIPFAQIGIIIDLQNDDEINRVYMNPEGHIVVNQLMFHHKKIKKISRGSKFELIDLPIGCYSVKYGGSTDEKNKPKWRKIVVAVIVVLVFISLTVFICYKKRKYFLKKWEDIKQKCKCCRCCCKKKNNNDLLHQNLDENINKDSI